MIMDFLFHMIASTIGTLIAFLIIYPFMTKRMGRKLGNEFAHGINELYEEKEKEIKRKTF